LLQSSQILLMPFLPESFQEFPFRNHRLRFWQRWYDGVFFVKFISVSNKNTSKSFIFLTNNYITDAFTVEKIHSIYMGRGEILPLSYNPNVIASDTVCPVCNMREQENILHFIGRCPILREIRLLHFGKAQLQPRDVFNLLHGQCWSTLYNFINQALKYRNNILTESF